MMLKGLLVLGAVFALSDAFPWRYSNLFHAEQKTHEVARTTSVRDSICKSVDGPTGGISLQSTDIHVCDFTTQDVCVYLSPGSERRPCCGSLTFTEERIASNLTERVTVRNKEYFVRFYVESEGSCYVVKEAIGSALAPFCVNDTRCQPGCVDLPSPICEIGVVSCVDGNCTCREGYAQPDCCTCDLIAGYYRNITSGECLPCMCCIDGTDDSSITCDAIGDCGGCATGFFGDKCCERQCRSDTDFYFLVDTTRSYRNNDLCLQTYTMMEIVTALNLGTGDEQSLVGNILYPAPTSNRDNTSASYLNQLGDTDANDCSELVQKLEDLQVDIFRGIFATRSNPYTPIYATRGDHTLPQNAITLLADALDKRPLTDRRIAGIVLTDGEHDQTSLSLEDARNLLPAELDLIAAGFLSPTEPNRDALMDDLQIIAGTPGNVILEESIPALAHSIVTLLVQKGIICPDDGERILGRISQNNFGAAQTYCSCLQSMYNEIGCNTTPVKPACPAPTLPLAEEMYSKVKDEDALEEEILAAVENVLKHHGH